MILISKTLFLAYYYFLRISINWNEFRKQVGRNSHLFGIYFLKFWNKNYADIYKKRLLHIFILLQGHTYFQAFTCLYLTKGRKCGNILWKEAVDSTRYCALRCGFDKKPQKKGKLGFYYDSEYY